jgi:hypothetical protein
VQPKKLGCDRNCDHSGHWINWNARQEFWWRPGQALAGQERLTDRAEVVDGSRTGIDDPSRLG